MNTILHELANQVAPLLVQLAGAILLALLSLLVLKARRWLDQHLTPGQEQFLNRLAAAAVQFAEAEGAGQAGTAKAQLARDWMTKELTAAGISSVGFDDIQGAVTAAVQRAWSREIGPTYNHPDSPATPEQVPAAEAPVSA